MEEENQTETPTQNVVNPPEPVVQTPEVPTALASSNSRKYPIWGGIIVLILLLLTSTAYFAYRNMQLKKQTVQPTPVAVTTPTPSPTTSQCNPDLCKKYICCDTSKGNCPLAFPQECGSCTKDICNTTDENANWKSHSSDRVSFRYPGSLTLEERQKDYFVLLSNPNEPQSVVVSIDARLEGSYTNYDSAVTSTKAGLTDAQVQEINNGVKISGKVGPGYGGGTPITIALFRYKQGAAEAETTSTDSSTLQIFNQILSTFKFLD